MSDRKTIIILAGSRHRAWVVAARLGVAPSSAFWPTCRADLGSLSALPVYVDRTLWDHPNAEELADYASARWLPAGGRFGRAPLPMH